MRKRLQSFIAGVLLTTIILTTTNVFSSTISTTLNSAASTGIVIDGIGVVFTQSSGLPFIDSSNRTQVPLRATMEQFGATVEWDSKSQTAIVKKDGTTVKVPIGKYYIYKNDLSIANDTAAIIKDNRTYLPIRAVLEAFEAEVDWDNVNSTVVVSSSVGIIGEVEARDFATLLNESNDKREDELKKNYIYNISGYMEDFSKTLDYFTEDEVKSLMARKNKTLTLTQAQAIQDAETYFKYLEANYAAYNYFGGAEAFNGARTKVLQALSDKSQITYNEFASILQSAMSFIRDGHFAINNIPIVSAKDVWYEYYRCDNQSFAKDDAGYFKVYNDTKWYVTGFSNKAVTMKPTLLSSGKIVYSPVFFAPVTELESASEITLSNGTNSRIEKLKWVQTSTFNGQNLDVGSDLIEDLSGTKYIPFRRPFFNDANIPAYRSAGESMKNERVIILDNRSNNGGGDRHQQPWFTAFAGGTYNFHDARAYKVNKFSMINFANNGNPYVSDSAYLGKWRTLMAAGRWYSNNTKIIVLMDDMTGSSGENMMYMLRTLDNVIFVGSNTYGCTICGNYVDIYLPNSGMPVRSGMMLALPETDKNIDGIGLEPDIWCDPNSSLETVLNMIKYYQIK